MENIFIYVSDALRYDHVPESIAEEGNVIPTLAPAGYTPISFSSLLTGQDPRNHDVRSFYDTLEAPTVFDVFDNHSFYDHPDDAICKNVLKKYDIGTEIDDMEEPFIYIERALDTHEPYSKIGHGNEIPDNINNDKSLEERYRNGVNSTEKHFWNHVAKLKEQGLYENTLIIFTSDHGEFLGETKLFKERTGHNRPITTELSIVPTVFLNYENNWNRARTIDIIPTALSAIEHEPTLNTDGLDLHEKQPDNGYTMLQINTSPLLVTGCSWSYKNGSWHRNFSGIKTDIGTLIIDIANPIRKKIRNSRLSKIFTPDNIEQRSYFEPEDDLEDIEF